MSSEITLDKEVFKALAGDTRVSVLKALLERRKTQSELAKELSIAPPTVKDHVDILVKAGLVREVDDGHKWKYIELTVKGKGLLQPQDQRILVLLGSSLVGILGAGFLAYNQFLNNAAPPVEAFSTMAAEKSMDALTVGTRAAADSTLVAPQATSMVVQTVPLLPIPELAVLVLCLVVFGVSIGMWIKQTY